MFDFFEGLIEKIGVKLIGDFTDKIYDWIKDIKNNSNGENNDNGGYSAKIGSSGDYAQIGSSGDSAKIGSSGNSAQIGSSGYSAKIGSSGNYAKIGSSGYSAKIDISGDDAVGFACGFKSIIKAKKGTWISLCEYQLNEEKQKYIPVYALSAQIGNKDYKDYKRKNIKRDRVLLLT